MQIKLVLVYIINVATAKGTTLTNKTKDNENN